MTSDQILLALPGILALLGTTIKIIVDWRKGKAEAADLLVDSATDLVKLLREEMHQTKDEIVTLKARIRRLERQVRKMGAVPVNGPDPIN